MSPILHYAKFRPYTPRARDLTFLLILYTKKCPLRTFFELDQFSDEHDVNLRSVDL